MRKLAKPPEGNTVIVSDILKEIDIHDMVAVALLHGTVNLIEIIRLVVKQERVRVAVLGSQGHCCKGKDKQMKTLFHGFILLKHNHGRDFLPTVAQEGLGLQEHHVHALPLVEIDRHTQHAVNQACRAVGQGVKQPFGAPHHQARLALWVVAGGQSQQDNHSNYEAACSHVANIRKFRFDTKK